MLGQTQGMDDWNQFRLKILINHKLKLKRLVLLVAQGTYSHSTTFYEKYSPILLTQTVRENSELAADNF